MTPEQAFGQILREARTERGLSQERLALESGYSLNYISRLERGLNSPTLGCLFRLAAVLGASAAELVRETQARTTIWPDPDDAYL